MTESLKPQPTDVRFERYREPGDPGCLCSRCLTPIGEKIHPIVWFAKSGSFILRYHPACLGIIEHDEADDDWEDDLEDLRNSDRL